VCNKSKEPNAFFAVGSRVVGPADTTRFQGWWQVALGQCTKIATFPPPGFVFYARSPSGMVWSGKPPVPACVNIRDAFDVTLPTGTEIKQCPADQVLVPFTLMTVKEGQSTFTLNLN
jgi:hypothetical protein